jgi:hypothetical protein
MEAIMATSNPLLIPLLLASVLGAAGWLAPLTAAAQTAVTGTATDRGSEPVVFGGHASISGRVIHDADFGAPPVLQIIVDLGSVTARGVRSGHPYEVHGDAILHRPLQPFEEVEVGISFAPQGNLLEARSALASFGVHYRAGKGVTTTPVKIVAHPPS